MKAPFDIRDFGAAESAAPSANAKAINAALEAASGAGGGMVAIPPGTWNTGTIRLRSHVELRLEKGAVSLNGGAGRMPERVTFRNCSRKCLDRIKVRHHRGWGGPRDERFMDDSPVAGLVVENCQPASARESGSEP